MPTGVYTRIKRWKLSEEHKAKLSLAHKGNPTWNKGLKGLKGYRLGKKHTLEAKLKMSKSRAGVKRKPLSEEHKRKLSVANSGSNNHFWKGGMTFIHDHVRTCFKYRQWRSDVFQRDSYRCVWCGDDKGGNLQADHIEPLSRLISKNQIKSLEEAVSCEEIWNINNGRTLCIDCHKTTDTYAGKLNKKQ